jgi:eukaryotic-like serine/threonine-protein kinase
MLDLVVCRGCRSIIEEPARFCPSCGLQLEEPAQLGQGSVIAFEGLGQITVMERLGEGGMGVVYRGWLEYVPTGRLAGTPSHPVAVKVLRPELRGRERARRMFLREAMALERLAHPNIVHFVALYDRDSQMAIVMEVVHGESLSRLIRQGDHMRPSPRVPCLTLDRAWHYLSQLLGALAAVHTIGILHRDIKAANVLIRPDGVAKLTDFGIARLPDTDARNTGGLIAGTGAYMAPEHVRGEEIDPRADLYAAAIVFYEMLTGTTPFDSPQRDEAMLRVAQLDEAPQPLGHRLDGIPPALDVVMAHALAKDRLHRYATAVDLGEALREALGYPPGPAWSAQLQFAALARTISQPIAVMNLDVSAQAEVLRTAMMTPLGH